MLRKTNVYTIGLSVAVMIAMLLFPMVDVYAGDSTGSGTDYDDTAYYNVTWGEVTVPSEGTEWHISHVIGDWGDVYDYKKVLDEGLAKLTISDVAGMIEALKYDTHSLLWYGWVDADGKWNGHVSGYPAVINTVTGESVNVDRWEIDLCYVYNQYGGSVSLPLWSISGTGDRIDEDNVSPEAADEMGSLFNKTAEVSGSRGIRTRLYLSDGNSISLAYADGGGTGYAKPFDKTADGDARCYYVQIYKRPDYTKIGNICLLAMYLQNAVDTKEYHFNVEKTVSGVADDAAYTFPVQVSINGGAEMTVEIETTGNGTFSKEVTFTAYPGTYSISAREDADDMPADTEIISGEATAVASESTVEIDDSSTLSIENKAKELHVTYVAKSDPEYGSPADCVTPVDSTKYKYKDTVIVADNLTSSQGYAIVDGKKIQGTWTFTSWDKEDFNITEDTIITGSWNFTPKAIPTDLTDTVPLTGDESSTLMYLALMLGAVAAAVILMVSRVREKK